MALLKCKECGHEVSDKASACPNCGCPIEGTSVCGECGQPLPAGVDACPNCGCLIKKEDYANKNEISEESQSVMKSNAAKWALIALLVCLIGLGCYFIYKGGSEAVDNPSTKTDSELLAGVTIPEGKYCIILHNDNYGEFIAPNGGRICGLKMIERDGMLRFNLTKKLTILGHNTDDLIISGEYLFSNYSDYLQLKYNNSDLVYAPVTQTSSNDVTLFVVDFTDTQIEKQEPKIHEIHFAEDEYTMLYYKDKTGALYGPGGTYLCGMESSYTEDEYRMVKTVDIYDEPIDRLSIYNDRLYKSSYDIISDKYAHAGDKSKSIAPVDVTNEGDLMIVRFPAVQQDPVVFEENQSSSSRSGSSNVASAFRNAKTMEEVGQLIDNTTWHYTPNTSDPNERIGYWFKVSFNNGFYTLYRSYPSDGEWLNKEEGRYEVFEDRFSNTGERFIGIRLLDELFNFVLIPSECQISVGFGRDKYYGQIEYGDYQWD